ncbi:MAG: FAD-dependent oxidoreductase [Planctomycetota bacterium]|nr:MAG: FAD-dependent oxidoreductase [Planctomycetota bacterium]
MKYDTVIIGAGPAGVAAAIKSGRLGNNTLLIEKYGFAGGMATAGLVNPFAGNCYVNQETGQAGDLVEGVFKDVLDGLRKENAVIRCKFAADHEAYYDAFDETQLRILYDNLLKEANVNVLFHSRLLDAKVADNYIDSIRVITKNSIETIESHSFIDSTGDADLADKCNVEFSFGRTEDQLCQPMTLMFRMGGIDKDQLMNEGLRQARKRVTEYFVNAQEEGRLDYDFKPWVQFYDYPRKNSLHFNMTRIPLKSGLSSKDLSEAEQEGRRQAKYFSDWVCKEVPWFKNAYIETMGVQIGVRETRRIIGKYEISKEDIIEGARFEDGIARSGYFIDIHPPSGKSNETQNGIGKIKESLVPKQFYEIPYRCLQPKNGPQNLLVACRALSSSFEAHAAIRVMATMHMVGEAAGIATAIAKESNQNVSTVPGEIVRKEIGYMDEPLAF